MSRVLGQDGVHGTLLRRGTLPCGLGGPREDGGEHMAAQGEEKVPVLLMSSSCISASSISSSSIFSRLSVSLPCPVRSPLPLGAPPLPPYPSIPSAPKHFISCCSPLRSEPAERLRQECLKPLPRRSKTFRAALPEN